MTVDVKNNSIKFRNSTIFRIALVIVILVLPVNILTVVLSTMVLRQSQNEIAEEIQTSLDASTQNIESGLTGVTRQLAYMGMDHASFTILAASSPADPEYFSNYQEVGDAIENLQLSSDLVDLAYFGFTENDLLICGGHPGISTNAYQQLIDQALEREDSGGMQWAYCELDGVSALFGFSAWRNMYYGVLLNLERTLRELNLADGGDDRVIFFTNQSGNILTAAGRQFLKAQGISLEQMRSSDKYLVYSSEMEGYDLTLMEVIDSGRQMAQLPLAMRIKQVVSIVIAVLVVPVLLYGMSRLVSRPLNRLVGAIDHVEQGDLNYRIEEHGRQNEFERINHSFNSMMDQVNDLKIDVYEKELEKKDIKMQYLSQQIQPHFILNALNLLYSYEPEEYPLIQKMILCISKYFRYVVKMDAEFVELRQELDHIKNYFEIQKARFPGLFFSIVECAKDLETAMIPPLLVQNFAENAIKHSLKIGNKITIFVTADHAADPEGKDMLRIRLEDTGEGMPDELLAKIETFKRTGEHQEGLGVGIQNSIERLKYLYGDRSTITIGRDEVYGGTKVEIILPIYYEMSAGEWNENTTD